MERRGSVEQRQQTHLQSQQQLTGCDIVKRGTLYVKHPPSSFLPTALSIQVCIVAASGNLWNVHITRALHLIWTEL